MKNNKIKPIFQNANI